MRHWPIHDRWADVAGDYLDALSDLPPDLAERMRQRAVAQFKFRPTVAELRGAIADDISARRLARTRLELAAMRATAPTAPDKSGDISPEAQRILARLKEAAAARRMPVEG